MCLGCRCYGAFAYDSSSDRDLNLTLVNEIVIMNSLMVPNVPIIVVINPLFNDKEFSP